MKNKKIINAFVYIVNSPGTRAYMQCVCVFYLLTIRPRRSLELAVGIGRKNIIVALSQLHDKSPLNCVIACQAKLRSKYSRLADSVLIGQHGKIKSRTKHVSEKSNVNIPQYSPLAKHCSLTKYSFNWSQWAQNEKIVDIQITQLFNLLFAVTRCGNCGDHMSCGNIL